MLIQTFVPKLAVEALDVGILHGSAGIDEVELHSSFLCPAEHGLAGELRSVVHYQHLRQTSALGQFLQYPSHPLTGDGGIHRYDRTLSAEVVHHCQGPEPAAVPEAVMDEV